MGKCAQHLGTVIRNDYAMNHFDAVNQALGLRGFFNLCLCTVSTPTV